MRIWIIAVVSAIAGVSLGMGVSVFQLGLPGGDPLAVLGQAEAPQVQVALKRGDKLLAGRTSVEFENMPQGGEDYAVFVFSNRGEHPLTLELGESSCKCTIHSLAQNELPPGGQTEVELKWLAADPGPFRHHAVIRARDDRDRRTEIKLEVTGDVTRDVSVDDVALGWFSPSEQKTAKFLLLSYHTSDLEIQDVQCASQETARFFEIKHEPLAAGRLNRGGGNAKAGFELTLKVKPGLPRGPIQQTIRVVTNLKTVEASVRGHVVGDVTLVSPRWLREKKVLLLGKISRGEGTQETVYAMVRGSMRDKVHLSVAGIEPREALQVALGKPEQFGQAKRWPLHIEVPPNQAPVMNRQGEGRYGKVVLKITNHPQEKDLLINVSFAIKEP